MTWASLAGEQQPAVHVGSATGQLATGRMILNGTVSVKRL